MGPVGLIGLLGAEKGLAVPGHVCPELPEGAKLKVFLGGQRLRGGKVLWRGVALVVSNCTCSIFTVCVGVVFTKCMKEEGFRLGNHTIGI